MKTKYLRLSLITAVLILVLSACAASPSVATTEPTQDQSAATAAPTTPPETAAAPTPTEEATQAPSTKTFTVGMMVIASVPALETVQKSFIDTLAKGGYEDGKNLKIIKGNAEGDIATLNTIAQQFIDEKVDLIVTTSTPAAQAAYNATKNMPNPTPIIFTTVTDPAAAGIAPSPDKHPAWMTGSQLYPPLDQTFDTMFEIKPGLKVIGFLYNPAEANSAAQTEVVKQIAAKRNVKLEIATVSNSSEIQTAAESLASRGIDMFYFTQDSTVASGSEAVIKVANDNHIPIITNDIPTVAKGGAVAVGGSLAEDGRQAGEMAIGFFNGTLDIAKTDIKKVSVFQYFINQKGAAAEGITLPQSLIGRAIDQTPK